MKRKGNKKNVEKDRERLMSLVEPEGLHKRTDCVHGTLLGVFIVYGVEGVDMEIFCYSYKYGKVVISRESLTSVLKDNQVILD